MESSRENSLLASIVSVQLCNGHRRPMQPVPEATLLEDYGLEGDRHARAGSTRQILLIESETLEALGIATAAVKENITTKGIALMNLAAGQRLRLGDNAELEITEPCDPCARMDEIRAGLRQRLEGRRGMLARVVRSGSVRPGDAIRFL